MIRRLDQITNLAIVGMSVVVPSGGGLDEFGRLVYRGLPLTGQFGEVLTIEAAAIRSVTQVCSEARRSIERMPVISLSPAMVGILQDNRIGSRVQEVSGVSAALLIASDWLQSGSEDVVLLVEIQEDPQAVCALLVAEYRYAQDNARPVYARVVGAAESDGSLSAAVVTAVLQEAHQGSGVRPEVIGLIETATITGSTIRPAEADGLLGAFGKQPPQTCALGSSLPGLLGLAKTAWCLSRRVIPGTPGWCGPEQPKAWQFSPFYVPTESRAWFIPSSQGNRCAGLDLLAPDGKFTYLLLSETAPHTPPRLEASKQEALRLFPSQPIRPGSCLKS